VESAGIADRGRAGLRAVDLGLIANVVLAGAKLSGGLLGQSAALVADGINSLSDVAYYVVVRVLLVFARKPADAEHPYGHERLESIGALAVGSFVVATGLAVSAASGQRAWELAEGQLPIAAAAEFTLWIALVTAAIKLALFLVTRALGRGTGNPAVLALALDHRNDVFASLAAALGIAASRAGHGWVDPAAGVLVGLLILRTGIGILRESSQDLLGTQPGRALQERVDGWLAEVPGVASIERLHAHSFGPWLVLEVTIGVDGGITVAAGDVIADAVERKLFERLEFLRAVHVHYHPVGARGPTDRRLSAIRGPA